MDNDIHIAQVKFQSDQLQQPGSLRLMNLSINNGSVNKFLFHTSNWSKIGKVWKGTPVVGCSHAAVDLCCAWEEVHTRKYSNAAKLSFKDIRRWTWKHHLKMIHCGRYGLKCHIRKLSHTQCALPVESTLDNETTENLEIDYSCWITTICYPLKVRKVKEERYCKTNPSFFYYLFVRQDQ